MAYAVTRNRLYAWLVTGDRLQWRGIDISRNELVNRVRRIRQSVDLSQPAPAVLPPAMCAVNSDAALLAGRPFDACAAKDLYDDILGDFDLSDIQHLIVAPDGPWETLPFSLLITQFDLGKQPHWLIEERSISRIPTTASLRALRAGGGARSVASKPFLGIAPGQFSAHVVNSPPSSVLADLPGTIIEVNQLARVMGAGAAGLNCKCV